MKKFNSLIYNSLVDIDEVKNKQGYDKELLRNLGNIIKKYHWQNEIAISLIHRHFDLAATEKMVSDYNLSKKEWISRPVEIDESKLIPWNWKVDYDQESKSWTFFPLDFLYNLPKFSKEKQTVGKLMSNKIFLDELALMMVKEGITDVFGVALLMSSFNDSSDDMVMFETNNKFTRTSNAFFIPKSSLNNPDAITQWHFRNEDFYVASPGTLRWCDHL